jgi:hypothetical protein
MKAMKTEPPNAPNLTAAPAEETAGPAAPVLRRPFRAHWVCRDWSGTVRIRSVEVVVINRGTREARVAFHEGHYRVERDRPVPFAELASSPQKAVRLALALVHAGEKNFPRPARPIEPIIKCTKTAPVAEKF